MVARFWVPALHAGVILALVTGAGALLHTPESASVEPSGTIPISALGPEGVSYYTPPASDVAKYTPPDTFMFVGHRSERMWEARALDGGVLMRFFGCVPVDAGVFWCPQGEE